MQEEEFSALCIPSFLPRVLDTWHSCTEEFAALLVTGIGWLQPQPCTFSLRLMNGLGPERKRGRSMDRTNRLASKRHFDWTMRLAIAMLAAQSKATSVLF